MKNDSRTLMAGWLIALICSGAPMMLAGCGGEGMTAAEEAEEDARLEARDAAAEMEGEDDEEEEDD